VQFAVYKKGARSSTKQKHTNPRSDRVYDKNQNQRRGEQNQKFKPTPNPNKKGNPPKKKAKP
jgi:hypothetical protein